jgi:hypothetical protein
MYYLENYKKLGEQRSITYGNMYINNIQLGCDYVCKKYKLFCPEYIRDTQNVVVPDFFKNMLKINL